MERLNNQPVTTSLQQLFGGKPTPPLAGYPSFDEKLAAVEQTGNSSAPVTTSLQQLFGGKPTPAWTENRPVAARETAAPTPTPTPAAAIVAPAVTPPAAPSAPTPVLQSTPAASTPIDPSRLEAWEGMFFDPLTGEGIVLQNRDSELGEKTYLRTGWFFERPTQAQPSPGASLEDRSHQERISPFGFLTQASTDKLMEMLAQYLPSGARVEGTGAGSANASFPVSAPQREIVVSMGDRMLRFPAGLIARTICNYTSQDAEGTIRQNADFVLRNSVMDLGSA